MADLTPERAPARLCEISADARAAVLLDENGLAGSGELDPDRAGTLAELAAELFEAAAEAGGDPPHELEAQVDGGAVFAVRRPPWTLATVARRAALASLMLYDLRAVLAELEGERGIHVLRPGGEERA